MPVIATLTEAIKDSIQIDSFIYHIIRQGIENPEYNDEVLLSVEQKEFFETQIRSACDGTQFCFSDKENNTFFSDCTTLLENVRQNLSPISRRLASRFFDSHNKSMSEGVFIISVISILHNNQRKKLLSFLKVDYSTVYQQNITHVDGRQKVSLTRVIDSLADSPKALQKWAIVDPSDLFAWDVIALQRGKSNIHKDTDVAISGYFKRFLQVHVRETASTLTRNSVSETNKWSRSLDDLPEDMSRSDFKARAINYFQNSATFDTDNFIEQVLGSYVNDDMTPEKRQEREEIRDIHKRSLRENLAVAGIAGQVFESKPSSIPSNIKKTVLKTFTGVTVTYQGTKDANNIAIEKDGEEMIVTIRTTQLDEI